MGEGEEAGVPISPRPAQEEEEGEAVVEEGEAVEVGVPQERATMVRLTLRRSTATSSHYQVNLNELRHAHCAQLDRSQTYTCR